MASLAEGKADVAHTSGIRVEMVLLSIAQARVGRRAVLAHRRPERGGLGHLGSLGGGSTRKTPGTFSALALWRFASASAFW
jgi:hypothetical protein